MPGDPLGGEVMKKKNWRSLLSRKGYLHAFPMDRAKVCVLVQESRGSLGNGPFMVNMLKRLPEKKLKKER